MSYAEDHVDAFNHAVRTGDWKSFSDRFAEAAVLEFVGPPVGPFIGREAILNAYTASPPDDTIEIHGPVVVNGAELVVPYMWRTTGATGTMLITVHSSQVAHLTVTFD
jgi:steroid Delta-isomerase